MKHIYLMALLLVATLSYCQLPNDDCHTATDAGLLTGAQLFTAYNGAQYDTCLQISNAGATTSYPYLYTTATCGNNTTTGINTDVWMKFVTYTTFGITGLLPQGATTLDTVSITFWKGADCSALQAIARLTYPLGTPGYFYDTIWANSADTIDTFYLQISGLNVTDTGSVYLCITGIAPNTGSGGGCYPANAVNDTICSTYRITTTNALTNNNGTATITMLGGNGPFTYLWGDGNTDSIRNNLDGGVYLVAITDVNGCAEREFISIYSYCPAQVSIIHNSFGNYTFTASTNTLNTVHYTWIIDNDTIVQDSTVSIVYYRFDTAGTYSVCLSIKNDVSLCAYDTCLSLTAQNLSYLPLLDSINIWHYTSNIVPVIPEEPPVETRSNSCDPTSNWSWYNNKEFTAGDTSINGLNYKRLLYSDINNDCLRGFIREETEKGRVYYRPDGDSIEMLMYDFGMAEGDTIGIPSDPRGNPSLTRIYRLDSIRPFIAGHTVSMRRQFYLKAVTQPNSQPVRWVEGIGTLYELLYPYINNVNGGLYSCPEYWNINAPQILTCYEHENLDYYAACALQQVMAYHSCFNYIDTCSYYTICGGIEDLSTVAALDVYPNPTLNNVTIKLTVKQSAVFAVRVIDIQGQYVSGITQLGRLTEGEHQTEIPLTGLPAGMYFIECSTGEGKIYERVAKQ